MLHQQQLSNFPYLLSCKKPSGKWDYGQDGLTEGPRDTLLHFQGATDEAPTILGTPEPEQPPAGTLRHVWPKLSTVFQMLLVKLCNSLSQDPGSSLLGGDTWDRNPEKPLSSTELGAGEVCGGNETSYPFPLFLYNPKVTKSRYLGKRRATGPDGPLVPPLCFIFHISTWI